MPIRAADPSPGVGEAAKQVAGHAGTLAKLGLELARLEVKNKAGALGLGIGAVVLAVAGLAFALATVAVALAIVLDTWLALLLVSVGLFTIAGVLGLLARSRLRGDTAGVRDNGRG